MKRAFFSNTNRYELKNGNCHDDRAEGILPSMARLVLMSKPVMVVAILALTFSGCKYKSDSYKQLEAEKDSLLLEEQKKSAQVNQMLSVINMVEENFDQIKEAENYVTFQANQEQVATDSLDRIVQDIELIRKTLMENKSQITNLRNQLTHNRKASAEMKKLIARLYAQIEGHVKTITRLQEKLAQKDIRIKELDELVYAMGDSISNLKQDVTGKESQLLAKEEQMNKVWFVFGTKKELKAQKIATRNGLLADGFNKNYFLEADARNLNEISLYSKKAKILTNHPVNSYQFDRVNGFLVLKITDTKKFWEISHYLVIEVN
ncbi:MAG: hypothetical protein Q8914_02580 [Bacteroidota bacterium]|nr:hypothetical protein [Bacteroidota bacterium]